MDNRKLPRTLAVMGGAYGNLAALGQCLADASSGLSDESRSFLGAWLLGKAYSAYKR
jgi:hypothetical protein